MSKTLAVRNYITTKSLNSLSKREEEEMAFLREGKTQRLQLAHNPYPAKEECGISLDCIMAFDWLLIAPGAWLYSTCDSILLRGLATSFHI